MSYHVYIPSRGRARRDLQATLRALGDTDLRKNHTTLVVPAAELDDYRAIAGYFQCGLVARPEAITNLSQSLDWIIHELATPGTTAILADDDLKFARWVEPHVGSKLRDCTPEDVEEIFDDMHNAITLELYPMAGISARFGNNNRWPDMYQYGGRQMQIHAVDVDWFRFNEIHPSDVVTKSDFHMTLSVLERGQQNCILCYATVDQANGSNSEGGVSLYRTLDVMKAGSERLAELHPGYVKLVQKENKNWRGVTEQYRTDVRVSWRKAYEEAIHRHVAVRT